MEIQLEEALLKPGPSCNHFCILTTYPGKAANRDTVMFPCWARSRPDVEIPWSKLFLGTIVRYGLDCNNRLCLMLWRFIVVSAHEIRSAD